KALGEVERELEAARSAPAREAGPRLLAALRALAAAAGRDGLRGESAIARIETEAYSPSAASASLGDEILGQARTLAHALRDAGRDRDRAGSAPRVAAVLLPWLVVAGLGARTAHADQAAIEAARAAYQDALARTDRDARTSGFAAA